MLERSNAMMVVYNNEQFSVCATQLSSKRLTGMVKVSTGVVTDHDVQRVDEVAQDISWGGMNPISLGSCRLYFQLDNGNQVTDPLGRASQRLECVWEFLTAYEHELVMDSIQH
ncbi:MAG: hypothetical protein CTY12_01930 [Methylotenera sp.]|nr:MAG: hypothetical protein CTY12_01930 [Methylotenera sp.]